MHVVFQERHGQKLTLCTGDEGLNSGENRLGSSRQLDLQLHVLSRVNLRISAPWLGEEGVQWARGGGGGEGSSHGTRLGLG